MENKKHIFVTGITGNQGGAVARHLLAKGYEVMGLTRDAKSAKAQQLKKQGVHIVEGNLSHPSTFHSEMKKAYAVFFVQSLQGKNTEIQQGKQFIDAIAVMEDSHLVYASVLGADLNTGVPHFDSKYEIEKHIKASINSYTILRPASFYENHLHPQVVDGIKKGKYVSPLHKTCKQQMIGVDHIGKIAANVISNPKEYLGKTLSIATDEYQIGDLPPLFSRALNAPVRYKKLPGIIVRLAMGKDLYKMFAYMNKHDFCVVSDIQNVRDEFRIKGNFKNWINENFTP